MNNQEKRKELILTFLQEPGYKPMRAKELAMIFSVSKKEFAEFRELLEGLVKEGKIEKTKQERYRMWNLENHLKGIFRGNEKGFGFVKIEGKEDEIYIPANKTNQALNGDTVLIEITRVADEKYHEEGRIVKVVKHEKDTLVGIYQKSRNFGFVIPDDKRFGTDIYISKKNSKKAKQNDKVVVKIKQYPIGKKNAEGEIIEVIGNKDQAGIDMLSLVKEYKLPYEFPVPVIEEAKSIRPEISKKDIPHRLDLREKEIFTIDGEDAKDLDDAVEVSKKENGNFLLGVHIADVSYYVREGSHLDKEAIIRGTSVYMMDRVVPMLPKELSNGICSLNAGEDRFAISVLMEIDEKGKVVSEEIHKSIIKVTQRMNYHDVATILKVEDAKQEKIDITEEEKEISKKYSKYIEHFLRMRELARILKNRRDKAGSLNLDIPESKVILNQEGIAIDVKPYEYTEANEIIEQFMLTANETVAEKFFWLQAPFIYRIHETPDMEKVEELNKFLYNFGYKVKGIKPEDKDSIHPKAFAEVLEDIKGKEEERVISTLMLRTLKVAKYESENKGHFGIASKYYCHFTSPIRRYPDLFIHRVISSYLTSGYNLPDKKKEEYQMQAVKYAESSSEREKIAQKVERDAIDIKKAEYMKQKIGAEYEGIISNITSFGMFVELANTVEGLIRFENLGKEYFIYEEEKKQLIGEKTHIVYKVGDKVRIKVIDANKETRRIDFSIVLEEKEN